MIRYMFVKSSKINNIIKNLIKFTSTSTIFAHSSGSLPSGVAVIRISGKESLNILTKITKKNRTFEPKKLLFTKIYNDKNDILDHGMVVWMPGPNTFTGEDTVELYLHGSKAVVDVICNYLEKFNNVEHAKPGEFIKRAFYNGKYNISQVESINDLINAETESQRKLAIKQNDSGKYLEPIREKLINLLASIEACIDFAEDIDNQEILNVQKSADEILKQLKKYQSGAKRGSLIREGVRIALLGQTNVGKSSLINRLAEKDIAIVSNISGTTRDSIETKLCLESTPVYIIDTAGIRETDDVLEKEGINRSIKKAEESQIVVIVIDSVDDQWNTEISKIFKKFDESLKDKIIFCFNKVDLIDDKRKNEILRVMNNEFNNESYVFTSTINENGLKEFINILEKSVKEMCNLEGMDIMLSRQRHIKLLDEAINELELFIHNIDYDKALSAQYLRNCAECIGEISGTIVNEHILDKIFSQFCIGK